MEHGGTTGGYRAQLTRFPAQHTSVAVLCNLSTAVPATLALRVADYVLRKELAPAVFVSASGGSNAAGLAGLPRTTLPASDIARLAGTYYSAELDATYTLSAIGAALVLDRPRMRPDSLAVRDALTFYGSVGTLRFTLGAGRAESFVLTAGRVENVTFVRR